MENIISIFTCRCTWYGKPCNISEDFETVITDLGVCYTFNGKKPAVQVTQPGTKNNIKTKAGTDPATSHE